MTARDVCSCLRSFPSRARASTRLTRHTPSRTPSASLYHPSKRNLMTQEANLVNPSSTLDAAVKIPTFEEPQAKSPTHATYSTSVGILLCRSPIITRTLTSFEEAFYAYQRHLKSRLASPFPTDFYFTKGSLASKRWLEGEEQRERANALMPPNTTTQTGNDTTQTGGELTGQERALQAEENIASNVAMPRITQADVENDRKSLDRKLERTLYLLVKSDAQWQLPQGPLSAGELLHESSNRVLATIGGLNMNTWAVGRIPVGVVQDTVQTSKVYVMKQRIFAGQCQIQKESGVSDFEWLTKEEIRESVSDEYWSAVQCMLATQ